MRDEIEVMRVLRTPPMGKLVVAVGGARHTALSEVQDPALRQRLLAAIGELVVFAGGYDQLLDAGVAPPPGPHVAGTTPADEPLSAEQEAFLTSLQEELKASGRRVPEPGAGVPTATPSSAALDEPAAEGSATNLVADIDRILQRHLSNEPSLSGRFIHLEQPPDGALRIRVDDQIYAHPRDIEDETVRHVLRQALAEWEAR
ncbi:MAG: hypothetical protein RRC07_06735 [Anaerolineae bacterium]|nr:hypothetical protein [Anaerolineae bacterium]